MPAKRVVKKKDSLPVQTAYETPVSSFEEVQGGVPMDDDLSHIGEEPASTVDLYSQWATWDAEHEKKRARLTVIVALTMVAIGAVWVFGVSETVSSLADNSASALGARQRFVQKFATYQNELDKYQPASSSLATSSGPVEETTQGKTETFVESLKSHAADLLKQ